MTLLRTRGRKSTAPSHKPTRRAPRLSIERLERRDVPSMVSISDATASEGGADYRFTDNFVAPDAYGLAAGREVELGPDGKVYVGTRRGDFWILAASREKKVLSMVDFKKPISGTATAANGTLFVATMSDLYALRQGSMLAPVGQK